MQEEFLKIPKERVAVLIGAEGSTKRKVEKLAAIRLKVDSGNGEVEISSAKADGFAFMKAVSVVKAIARGFNPEKALMLLDENHSLEIIELEELLGKSDKTINAKKGRVIGEQGRAREKIERETGTYLSVYGRTISIIGRLDDIPKAKKAIEMLIEGAMHRTAYKYLENRQKEGFEI